MLITVGLKGLIRTVELPRGCPLIQTSTVHFPNHSRYIFYYFFSAEPAMAIKETVIILSIIFSPLLMEAKQPMKPEGKHSQVSPSDHFVNILCVCLESSLISEHCEIFLWYSVGPALGQKFDTFFCCFYSLPGT